MTQSLDPTTRFTGLSEVYARHRPDYPEPALDFILARGGLAPGAVLVDVGCGTGISSRLFARRGLTVLGIEPNAEMRLKAEREPANDHTRPSYRAGSAEATGLLDACCDAILAAQAFHWFDPPRALAEFSRILRPGGWVFLMWNERDEGDPFTRAFGDIMRHDQSAIELESGRQSAGAPLLSSPLFVEGGREDFSHEQPMDEEGLIGRALSASYAPKEPAAREVFVRRLRELFSRWQSGGRVVVRYRTSVWFARKPAP